MAEPHVHVTVRSDGSLLYSTPDGDWMGEVPRDNPSELRLTVWDDGHVTWRFMDGRMFGQFPAPPEFLTKSA